MAYRKYIERKTTRSTKSLVVSLPISSYVDAPVESTEILYTRITSALPLPSNWIIDTATKVPITLCKLRISSESLPPRADILITLTITADKRWAVSFIHRSIDSSNCSLLSVLPPTVSSVAFIRSFMSLMDSSKMCLGNSDPTFLANWQQRSLTLHMR